jgi:phosphatidylinositol alpha-1,6-mannosyltransferase
LSPRGGGIAAAGRLLLAAAREWAAQRGVAVRLLTLGGPDEVPRGMDGEAFAGNRLRMACAVWRSQMLEGYRNHVYDFLGVARFQGVLPQRMRARYLVYLYGIECWRALSGSRRAAVEGATVRLACSDATIARFRAHNPEAPPVATRHLALGDEESGANGASTAQRACDDEVLDRIDGPFLLIVGRLAPGERYKGHDELLEAMARLASTHPELRLVIAGEGSDGARLAAKAAALGVADRVLFTGFVDASLLTSLYARCTALAMPSQGEGFGFVYLEAMRAGRPCIGLAGTAAAEIIVDRETGWLVERGVEPLVDAVEALLREPVRAAAMGAAGRARWQRDFMPPVFAQALAHDLDRLVA